MANNHVQTQPKGPLVLAILIITIGVGWLLSARGYGPGIDWVWSLGLGVIGILTFVVSGGLDKLSVVLGPFFLVSSLLSILRQTGKFPLDTEVPVLVILIGVLLLLAQMKVIPKPKWLLPPGDNESKSRRD